MDCGNKKKFIVVACPSFPLFLNECEFGFNHGTFKTTTEIIEGMD